MPITVVRGVCRLIRRAGGLLDASAVALDLKAFAGHGIAATLSSDAGTYVCNSLFYNLLNWAVTGIMSSAGFEFSDGQ